MRTMIELTDDQREALVDLAARRGLRGISTLVEEAIDVYLDERRSEHIEDALALEGVLSEIDARDLRRRIDGAWSEAPSTDLS